MPTKTGGISLAKGNKNVNQDLSDYDAQIATSSPSSTNSEYRVRRGDTACSIANRYKMTCSELLAVNGLNRDSVIVVGQTLRVTGSHKWHKVSSGQSACYIAEKYGVGCSALLRANGLTRNSVIRIGQRLKIPSSG